MPLHEACFFQLPVSIVHLTIIFMLPLNLRVIWMSECSGNVKGSKSLEVPEIGPSTLIIWWRVSPLFPLRKGEKNLMFKNENTKQNWLHTESFNSKGGKGVWVRQYWGLLFPPFCSSDGRGLRYGHSQTMLYFSLLYLIWSSAWAMVLQVFHSMVYIICPSDSESLLSDLCGLYFWFSPSKLSNLSDCYLMFTWVIPPLLLPFNQAHLQTQWIWNWLWTEF